MFPYSNYICSLIPRLPLSILTWRVFLLFGLRPCTRDSLQVSANVKVIARERDYYNHMLTYLYMYIAQVNYKTRMHCDIYTCTRADACELLRKSRATVLHVLRCSIFLPCFQAPLHIIIAGPLTPVFFMRVEFKGHAIIVCKGEHGNEAIIFRGL